MTRHRRRARIDADRFGHMRERERFLYEDPYGENTEQWPEEAPAGHNTNTSLSQYLLAAACTLLLTGTVIFGALYYGERTADKTLASANSEPTIGAALAPAQSASDCIDDGCSDDIEIARVAWRYFENNYQPETGLVNSVDGVETTTLWDTGSSLAAFIAARDFGFITQHDFDHSIMALLQTLTGIDLVNGVAPNILYNTRSARMVDYNNEVDNSGIGVSTIDLARSAFWLNTLQCMHPKYYNPVNRVMDRWASDELFRNGKLYGLARDAQDDDRISPIQQGRFGFEQYAGRIFHALGHPTQIAASYDNPNRSNTEILGVMIAHDRRDPRNTGVNNFVLTDSYTLDAMELGVRVDNRDILQSIFDVQKARWRETGIATALTDGHINEPPHYLYNTIFDAGLPFTTTTDTGLRNDKLRTISTRAAFMLATLFPDDLYSDVLLAAIESAYDPEKGWFSGVFENGGFNDVTTANTNGIILQTMLYRKYGVLSTQCRSHWGPAEPSAALPIVTSTH